MSLKIANLNASEEAAAPDRVRATFELQVPRVDQEALLEEVKAAARSYGTRLQETIIGTTVILDTEAPTYYATQNIIAAIHRKNAVVDHVEFRHGEVMEELEEAA